MRTRRPHAWSGDYAVLPHALDGAADLPGERIPTQGEQEALAAFPLSVALPDPDPGDSPATWTTSKGSPLNLTPEEIAQLVEFLKAR